MKTKHLISLIVFSVLFSAAASASMIIPASDKAKENSKAPEKSPVISEDRELERIDFIHYAKPPKPPKGPEAEKCYKLLGVKWKNLPVDYVINPDNDDGLLEDFVTSAISTSAETWDNETSTELLNDGTVDSGARYGAYDQKNAIVFGDYPDLNVIAVTSIWYMPRGRQIVEFDILFNEEYTWGDAETNSDLMDLQNIATHELGHGIGLGDIYSAACSEVTMYGYSENGEIKKRTLEQPDIDGLRKMYGM